jgi:transcription initiation factor TFIIIB Brf1 subunit/transcription initiation factor TFIIB
MKNKAIGILNSYAKELGISEKSKEYATKLYQEASENKLIRGRNIPGMVAASLALASHSNKELVNFSGLSYFSRVSCRKLKKWYNLMARELGLETPTVQDLILMFDYLSEETILKSKKILADIESRPSYKKRKHSAPLAGAIIYKASLGKENITQKELAEILGVTEMGIRLNLRKYW